MSGIGPISTGQASRVAHLSSGASAAATIVRVNAALDALMAVGLMRTDYSHTLMGMTPVSYWRLGDPSGAATDEKGANAGTYTNTPTLGATGLLTGDPDTAVTFAAASSQYVTIPYAAALHAGSDVISISAWFKRTAINAQHVIWSNGNAGGSDAELWFHSDNSLYFSAEGTGNLFKSAAAITDANTHHVVATKSGATSVVYLDGSVMAGTGANTLLVDSGAASTIGRDVSGRYFQGTIDEVAVWNRALTAAEVANLYAIGTTP